MEMAGEGDEVSGFWWIGLRWAAPVLIFFFFFFFVHAETVSRENVPVLLVLLFYYNRRIKLRMSWFGYKLLAQLHN